MAPVPKRGVAPGEVRIIGGTWRSRRLSFPASAGLRPTPDRVRETVFNWLTPALPGARCLDLFAGTGAFGFESVSRGAAHAVLVEKQIEVVAALRENSTRLKADTVEIVHADTLQWLRAPGRPFDIIFLDPPYASTLLGACIDLLEAEAWIKPNGLVYLEAPKGEAPPLPAKWQLLRSKIAGQVGYHLARKIKATETP